MVSFSYIITIYTMLIEEEEVKPGVEINPDALEAVFEDESAGIEEADVLVLTESDEQVDEIDIAFAANDEGYW
jgi:hypothetical protein